MRGRVTTEIQREYLAGDDDNGFLDAIPGDVGRTLQQVVRIHLAVTRDPKHSSIFLCASLAAASGRGVSGVTLHGILNSGFARWQQEVDKVIGLLMSTICRGGGGGGARGTEGERERESSGSSLH